MSLKFKVFSLSFIIALSILTVSGLAHQSYQLANTQKIIKLYEQKLQILKAMKIDPYVDAEGNDAGQISMWDGSQHGLFPLDWKQSSNNVKFIPPFYIWKENKIQRLDNEEVGIRVDGPILSVSRYQITSIVSDGIMVINFRQQFEPNIKKYKIAPQTDWKTQWHKAYQFEDKLLQWNHNVLHFYESKSKQTYTFKSQILYIATINQYKLLYVTRYEYGFLNVRTLQATSQYHFGSIAETAFKTDKQLFVLLKNHTILGLAEEKVVVAKNLSYSMIPEEPEFAYIFPYLFIHSKTSQCFNALQTTDSQIRYLKQMCLSKQQVAPSSQYEMDFFVINETIRVFVRISNKNGSHDSYQYELLLPFKQIPKQISFPYKLVILVMAVIIVVMIKSKKETTEPQQTKRKKKQISFNQIEDYLSKVKNKEELQKDGTHKKHN